MQPLGALWIAIVLYAIIFISHLLQSSWFYQSFWLCCLYRVSRMLFGPKSIKTQVDCEAWIQSQQLRLLALAPTHNRCVIFNYHLDGWGYYQVWCCTRVQPTKRMEGFFVLFCLILFTSNHLGVIIKHENMNILTICWRNIKTSETILLALSLWVAIYSHLNSYPRGIIRPTDDLLFMWPDVEVTGESWKNFQSKPLWNLGDHRTV